MTGSWALWRGLLLKELRELFLGRTLYALLVVLSVLTGASYGEAVALYGEASKAVANAPELSRGLSPFEGILVPTFGATYLVTTLLWPLIAIRQLGGDLESGALKLMLQLPTRLGSLVAAKLVALGLGWLLAIFGPLSAIAIWTLQGGHVAWPELLGLLAGHTLYAAVVACLSLWAVSWVRSGSVAALVVFAATLGSWALDFSSAGRDGIWGWVRPASLTGIVRPWEHGLFDARNLAGCLVVCGVFITLAGVGLAPGLPARQRAVRVTLTMFGCAVLALGAGQMRRSWDLTENRKNSFSPAEEMALSGLAGVLEIEVHLGREDPRYEDFERAVLAKLRRVIPHVEIRRMRMSAGVFGPGEDSSYGEVHYRYGGRSDQSRSTSPREVLPLLWALCEMPPPPPSTTEYSGYPLVVGSDRVSGPWFFGVLPVGLILGALGPWWFRSREMKERS